MKKISILISGRGSNMVALLEAVKHGVVPGKVVRVISNRADAAGLALAETHGVATEVVESKTFSDREAFDHALGDAVARDNPDLVVLAGFMRILGAAIVSRFAGKIINIHPALLPSYPGLRTHQRALSDGVKWHGCTVHFVTPEVDVGPIIGQSVVPVLAGDDEETLAARVLEAEHKLLVDCVRWLCEDRLVIDHNQVILCDARTAAHVQQCPEG